MRVLAADDDRIVRRLLEANLKKWGYDLTLAGPNGFERQFAGDVTTACGALEVSSVLHPADGTIELAPAVTGTTLTTVVVFIPLAFLQGIVGDFFRALAFTVTAAVLVSLFVALVLVPLAAGVGLSDKHEKDRPPGRHYGRIVRALVRHPIAAPAARRAEVFHPVNHDLRLHIDLRGHGQPRFRMKARAV